MRGRIVGCGHFRQIQLEASGGMPGADIVAACDQDIDRARASAPPPSVRIVENWYEEFRDRQ